MKPTAYLINTSRGAIIDEDDLYEILKSGKIAGAGLDVLENEPVPYYHLLLQLDCVVYTPHIGGSTEESLKRIGLKFLISLIYIKIMNQINILSFNKYWWFIYEFICYNWSGGERSEKNHIRFISGMFLFINDCFFSTNKSY